MSVFICPHFAKASESELDLLFTKASLTRSKDRNLFYYTHKPILVHAGTGIVSEAEILKEFGIDLARRLVVVVEGNTGTGKSELCAYLSFELEDQGRKVLHIEKNENLIDILTQSIPKFYKDNTGKDFPELPELQKLKTALKSTPELVATRASSGILLSLSSEGKLTQTESELSSIRSNLERLMASRLNILMEKGESPIDMRFIEENDFVLNPELMLLDGPPQAQAAELNKLLWEIIRADYKTPSLDAMIAELSKSLKEVRPVIIFEDFSITGLDMEKLCRYMESDSPDDLCDFVIAGTQDKLSTLHSYTRDARFKFYRTTDNSPEVLFLKQDSAFDFIKPFLSYLKTLDGSLAPTGGSTIKSNTICDRCRKCPPTDIEAFPLNQVFLERLYASLPEDEKTPRKYVDRVHIIINEYKMNKTPPSESSALEGLPTPSVDDRYLEPGVRKIFQWYGQINGDSLAVQSSYPVLFGYHVGGAQNQTLTAALQTGPGILGPMTGALQQEAINEELTKKMTFLAGFIDPWTDDPYSKNVTEFSLRFKMGLRRLIETATRGFSLSQRSQVAFRVGENEDIFDFNRQGGRDGISLLVSTRDFTQEQVMGIIQYALLLDRRLSQVQPNEQYVTRLMNLEAYPLAKLTLQFREKTRSSLSNLKFARSPDYDVKHLALAYWRLLMVLGDPFTEIEPVEIIKRLQADSEFHVSGSILELFTDREKEIVKDLSEKNTTHAAQLLVDEFFSLTGRTFDLRMVKEFSEVDPSKVIGSIARGIAIDKRIMLGDLPIADFIRTLSGFNNLYSGPQNWWKERPEFKVSVAKDIADYVEGIDLQYVRSLIAELRPLLEYDQDLVARLEFVSSQDERAFQLLLKKCRFTQSLCDEIAKSEKPDDWLKFRATLAVKTLLGDPLALNMLSLSTIKPGGKEMRKTLEELAAVLKLSR